MKAITYNSENQFQKQDGIAPNRIIYSGRIDEVSDADLVKLGIGYNDLATLLKGADGDADEDHVLLLVDPANYILDDLRESLDVVQERIDSPNSKFSTSDLKDVWNSISGAINEIESLRGQIHQV